MHHHRIYLRSRTSRHTGSLTIGAMYVELDYHHNVSEARNYYRYVRNLQRAASASRKFDEQDRRRARRLVVDLLCAGSKPGVQAIPTADWRSL